MCVFVLRLVLTMLVVRAPHRGLGSFVGMAIGCHRQGKSCIR